MEFGKKKRYTLSMPLFITATYQVRKESVEEVKKAIKKFTKYIAEHEKDTTLYLAWQDIEDITKFTHIFIFKDEEARNVHSNSEAVKEFEEVYTPALIHGPVVFKHYENIAEISVK